MLLATVSSTEAQQAKKVPRLGVLNLAGVTFQREAFLQGLSELGYVEGKNITIARSLVGNYITSLEMAGCSITLIRLDDELTKYWDAPVHTPALRWGV